MKRLYTLLISLVAFVSSMIAADITLYYVNSTGWSNVYAYVWDNATQTNITSYPGKKATKTAFNHNGHSIYSFTFDSSKADRIIFNNGSTTTSDKTHDLVVNASKPFFYDGIWYKDNTFKSKYTATLYKVVEDPCDVSIPSVICFYKSEEDKGNQLVGYVQSNIVEPSMTINDKPVHKIVVPFDEPVYVGVRYKSGYYGSHTELIASNITLYSNSYKGESWYKSLDEARYGVHLADLNQQPETGKIYLIAASSPKVFSSKYGTSSSYSPSGTSYKETINGENYYSYEVDANLYDKVIINKQEYSINWSKPYFYNGQWYAKLNEIPINKTLVEYCSTWFSNFEDRLLCLGNNKFKSTGDLHQEEIKLNNEDITCTFKYCDKKISKTLKAPVQSGRYNVVVTLNANTEEITAEWELETTGVTVKLNKGLSNTSMDLVGENLHTYAYSKLFEPGLYYYTITDYINSVTKKDVVFEIPEKGKYDLIWTYNATTGKVDLEIKKVVSEVTLYYVNNTAWTTVKAYIWDYATGTPINDWPGEAATKLDKTVDGYDVYSYTFDNNQANRILFNNGASNQTTDLTFDASKPYFYNGVWYETLTFDTNGGGTVDPTPTPDPEPEPDPDPVPNPDVAPLYVKGGFNNWEVNDTYKLTSADGNYYVANYSAGNEITISGNFKISNEDWSVNFGGAFIVEAGKSYMLTAGGANLDTAGKIKASKVEFTLSTGELKITGTTSSNVFDTTTDQGVAFVVNPRGASPVYVPLTYSYNAEYNTAQYTGTYTVTELGVTAKIGGLTNFNVIDYGTNGQPVLPYYPYDMIKGAYDGFTIEGDYKVGDVLTIFVVFDSDWYATLLINVQAGGTTPTPTPTPTPGGEVTLYYVNNTAWAAVKAYVWDYASDVALGAWPGVDATKTGKTVDGNDVYSYTFDSSLADRIIFNNGNGGVGNQTDDLTFEASKPYFYNGVWYETLTFDATGGDEGGNEGGGDTPVVPDPTPEPEGLAFFVAGNGGSDATGIWCNGIEWSSVGVETANNMTDADKDGKYEITFNQVPAGTWNFKVVAVTEGNMSWMGSDFLDTTNSSTGYTTAPYDGNIGFTLNAPADVTIKFNTLTGKIIVTTPSGSFGKVKIDYFAVANIDECYVENIFEANNNILKYTVDIQVSEEYGLGYAGFRILGNCNYAVYENNLLVEVTESGKYEVTIVFNGDYDNPEFTINAVKQGSTTEPDTPDDPDTPVNPGEPDTPVKPEPEPEPKPEPVVVIRELMLQPFERILPKTSTSTVATFILENASTATVSLSGMDADFFEIGEQDITEGECSVQIMFNPFVKGVYYATLTVTTDDNVSLSIDFAAVAGDVSFDPGDVPELNPDPVNPETPEDNPNVSVEEVSAVVIYAKEGTVYSEVDFEIYSLAGVNVTSLNGALKGVYVVKTTEGNRLVSVW